MASNPLVDSRAEENSVIFINMIEHLEEGRG